MRSVSGMRCSVQVNAGWAAYKGMYEGVNESEVDEQKKRGNDSIYKSLETVTTLNAETGYRELD